jgi:hypothetical protein
MKPVTDNLMLFTPLGAKISDHALKIDYELTSVKLPSAMIAWLERIQWPKDVKYKAKDGFKPEDTIYSLDFNAPIEEITKEHYNKPEFAGLISIAVTEHGQLVVDPSDKNPQDPLVYFIDNDDEDSFRQWKGLKIRLSVLLETIEPEK